MQKTPYTVLYVDHTARWSGGEIALLRLLFALDRKRFRPVVVLAEDGPLADHLRDIDVCVHIIPLEGSVRETRKDTLNIRGITRNLLFSGSNLFSYSQRIAAIAHQEKAILIHCNSLKSDIYGAIAGKMNKVPVIWHVRDFIDTTYLPRTTVIAFRSIARWLPSHILTNSQATLSCLFPYERDRFRATVAYNGLNGRDLAFPAPKLYNSWAGKEAIRIGLIGRLAPWKGQHVLIEAIKILNADRVAGRLPDALPPLRFLIAGDAMFGENTYALEVQQAAESVAHQVEWLGMVKDIPALLKDLDIMVHTSVTPEPFGQVVIEGMAAGLPVIATNGGGIPEIIEEGRTGLLVPMGDAQALATVLRKLFCQPEIAAKIGTNAYKEARTRFTSRKTAEVVENIYDRLIGIPSGGIGDVRLSDSTVVLL